MEQIDRHSAEDEKTETMQCASVCRQSKLHDCPIMLAGASTAAVRELGVYTDVDLGATIQPYSDVL